MRSTSILLTLMLALTACEDERRPPPVVEASAPPKIVPWALPDKVEPLVSATAETRGVELGGTRRHPECWETLESAGAPVARLPFADRIERAEHLASCGLEAMAALPDGGLALAWGSRPQPTSRATDLRVAVWGPDDRLRWTADMNRSRQAANWLANFRSSFITVFDKFLCAGTLWEGDTQVMCAQLASGALVWNGTLPFWSGIVPQPGRGGFVVADLNALSQRYPFDGAEMRYAKLEGLGGRAGYYATDGLRLYFAPSRIDAPPLIAYDLATFDEVWRTPLPEAPAPTLALAHADRVVMMAGEHLVALHAAGGEVAWAWRLEDDNPSIAADDELLYVLVRRPELPNQLVALDLATGARRWSMDTPPGTLRVTVVDGVPFVGSVRAVQRIITPGAPDGG